MLLLLIDHIVEFVEFNKQVIATKSCMIGYAIYLVAKQTKSYVRCNHIHGDHKCNKHQGMIFFLNFMPCMNLNVVIYRSLQL